MFSTYFSNVFYINYYIQDEGLRRTVSSLPLVAVMLYTNNKPIISTYFFKCFLHKSSYSRRGSPTDGLLASARRGHVIRLINL